MKARLKAIFITFLATTLFWCLVIVGFFWFFSRKSGAVSIVDDARQKGFVAMMYATSTESQPLTLTVEDMRTNISSTGAVLLDRKLPPSGDFLIGIKEGNAEKKP